MADITAGMVKELRERTGSGMMECKKALQQVGGDIEAAVELMRKAGQAKADKKAGRIAAEGLIVIKQGVGAAALVEINCETDFVTKNDDFRAFVDAVADTTLNGDPADLVTLLAEYGEWPKCRAEPPRVHRQDRREHDRAPLCPTGQ